MNNYPTNSTDRALAIARINHEALMSKYDILTEGQGPSLTDVPTDQLELAIELLQYGILTAKEGKLHRTGQTAGIAATQAYFKLMSILFPFPNSFELKANK